MGENGFEDIGKGEAVRAVWFGLVVLFGSGGDGYGFLDWVNGEIELVARCELIGRDG
jgi:hypothetical protein